MWEYILTRFCIDTAAAPFLNPQPIALSPTHSLGIFLTGCPARLYNISISLYILSKRSVPSSSANCRPSHPANVFPSLLFFVGINDSPICNEYP